MQTFVVLYHTPQQPPMSPPFATLYDAKSAAQAKKDCIHDNPTATVVWAYAGYIIDKAYDAYYETFLDD